MKIFRYIVPIVFLFCSVAAVAQMDNDGNFHWDELYTPDEILELDMSLPNKVDVSAIKNRKRVKYVKLRYNPWMASLPFDTTCFPNLESLSIETSLLIDLQGLEHFTQLKRLALIPDSTRWCRNVLQEQLPSVYSKVWNLTNLEELDLSIAPVAVADFSKLKNLQALKGHFVYPYIDKQIENLKSLRQVYRIPYLYPYDSFEEIQQMRENKREVIVKRKNGMVVEKQIKHVPRREGRVYLEYYNSYGNDTLHYCFLHKNRYRRPSYFLCDRYEKIREDIRGMETREYCVISDTISIIIEGLGCIKDWALIERQRLCVYCPKEQKVVFLFRHGDSDIEFIIHFAIIDLQTNEIKSDEFYMRNNEYYSNYDSYNNYDYNPSATFLCTILESELTWKDSHYKKGHDEQGHEIYKDIYKNKEKISLELLGKYKDQLAFACSLHSGDYLIRKYYKKNYDTYYDKYIRTLRYLLR